MTYTWISVLSYFLMRHLNSGKRAEPWAVKNAAWGYMDMYWTNLSVQTLQKRLDKPVTLFYLIYFFLLDFFCIGEWKSIMHLDKAPACGDRWYLRVSTRPLITPFAWHNSKKKKKLFTNYPACGTPSGSLVGKGEMCLGVGRSSTMHACGLNCQQKVHGVKQDIWWQGFGNSIPKFSGASRPLVNTHTHTPSPSGVNNKQGLARVLLFSIS